MDEKRVDEITNGIMGDAITKQTTARDKRMTREGSLRQRRKMAVGGLLGLIIGLAVGHFGFDSFMPAGLFGAVSGMAYLRWLNRK